MTKKVKYWVTTTRVKVNETEESFEYGSEFPELKDADRMKRLVDAGMLSTAKPTDISISLVEETNHFEPSLSYEESHKKDKESSKDKKEKESYKEKKEYN